MPPREVVLAQVGNIPVFPPALKVAVDAMPLSVQAAISFVTLVVITITIVGAVHWVRRKDSAKTPQTASDIFLSAAGIMDMKPVRELAMVAPDISRSVARIADALESIKEIMEERDEHDQMSRQQKTLLDAVHDLLDERLGGTKKVQPPRR